ncbi:MAG: helix-turn-helix transcriptional regulator, partial [Candidatus Aminicenantes bacterium]|nr:helix-turn-helix transcriptional regulator [Candidatus Aminicenantes bacterium]
MRHLLIFIYLLSSGCGLLLISLVVHRYRTFRQRHLRTYAVHLACLNLMTLADVGLIYITLNISHEKIVIATTLIIPWMLLSVLLYCALVGYAAAFMVMAMELRGKRILPWQKWVGRGGLIVALAVCAGGVFNLDFLMRSIYYLDRIVRALILIAAVLLFWQARTVMASGKRIALRSFSAFYIAVNLIYFLFYAGRNLWSSVFAFYTGFYFLCLNLLPLLFLGTFLHYYHGKKLLVQKSQPDMESTLGGYGISKREREIIQLICAGKSNLEIEQLLFISLKTVKFHLYNIYRKLGVRNRIELVNLVQGALVVQG